MLTTTRRLLPLLTAAVPLALAGEAGVSAFTPAADPPRITGRADRVVDYRLQGEVPQGEGGPALLRVLIRDGAIENAWVQTDRPDGVIVREMRFNDGVLVRGRDPVRMPMPCWPVLAIADGRLSGDLWRVMEGRLMSKRMRVDIDLASGAGTWNGESGRMSPPAVEGAIALAAEHDPAALGAREDALRPGFGWPQAKGMDGLGSAVPIDRPVVAGLGAARFVWKSQARLPFFYCGSSSPVADGDLVVVNFHQPTGQLTFTSGGRKFSATKPPQEVPYDWSERLLAHADDVIVGIDARSGLTRWRTELPMRAVNWQGDQKSMPGNTCAIAGGRVFATGFGGQIYALSAATGALIWESDLGPASARWREAAGAVIARRSAAATPPKAPKTLGHSDGAGLAKPIVVGDAVVFNAGHRELHAFDAATGRRLWSDPAAFLGWRGFARTFRQPDGRVLLAYPRVSREGSAFLLVDPLTGVKAAEYPLPFSADGGGTWLVWRDLLVHVPVFRDEPDPAAAHARVRAWRLGGKELTLVFTTETPGCNGSASLAIVHGTTLLFGGHRTHVIPAVDLETGRLLGALTSPNAAPARSPVAPDGPSPGIAAVIAGCSGSASRSPRASLAFVPWSAPDLPPWSTDAFRVVPSIAGLPDQRGLLSGSCPSPPRFAIRFFRIPPRGGHPCLGGRFPCIRARRGLSPPAGETCQAHNKKPTAFTVGLLWRPGGDLNP